MALSDLKPDRFDLRDYGSQPISISGKAFIADQSGALYWPAERALIVADLHFEKGSAYAARGVPLPPYDTRQTLLRLAETIDRYDADRIISLGDSFHDAGGFARMSDEDRTILRIIQDDRQWTWVTGNHDPDIAVHLGDGTGALGGEAVDELVIAGLTFRHEPRTAPVTHEIAGHLHPAARLAMYGYSLRRPCFVGNGRRLVMPAFGAFTGGLNVLDDAFAPLFGNGGFSVWLLGEEGLYPIATRQLEPDRR